MIFTPVCFAFSFCRFPSYVWRLSVWIISLYLKLLEKFSFTFSRSFSEKNLLLILAWSRIIILLSMMKLSLNSFQFKGLLSIQPKHHEINCIHSHIVFIPICYVSSCRLFAMNDVSLRCISSLCLQLPEENNLRIVVSWIFLRVPSF